MAARFWVGGTGTWDAVTTTNWASSSGGAGGQSAPTILDDVFFDGNSGTGTATLSTSLPILSLNCTGYTGTLTFASGSTNLSIGGVTAGAGNIALKFVSTMTLNLALVSGARITMTSTSGTVQTIDAGGQSFRNFDINGVGSSYQLASNLTGPVSGTTWNLIAGTFDANGYNVTCNAYSATGTGVRTLNMGSGTWTLTGNATTVWNVGSTVTNLTFNAGTATVDCTYSGSTGTRTIIGSVSTGPNWKISAGSDIVTMNALTVKDLDFTGFTGTHTILTNNVTITGSLTLGTGMTSSVVALSFQMTGTGSQTITCNGVTLGHGINLNGAGGTWTLGSHFLMDSTKTLTLTQGTFNANNFNVTCGIFSSSNSNTRTLTMGSGTWTLTGNAASIWQTTTNTNMTLNADTSTIDLTYSGSTGTRTIATNAQTLYNLKVTAGSDTIAISNSTVFNNLDFTGFSGTYSSNAGPNIQGDITFSPTMTVSAGTATLTFIATSGTKTITTNGITIDRNWNFSGAGGTWNLVGDLITSSTKQIILTAGTFNANGYNVTVGSFSSSNSNVRTLSLGSGTLTLTSTGTVYNAATSTNLTVTAGTSTILISDTSATSKTFAGGSKTYNNLTKSGGTGTLTISGNNTFSALSITTPPSTILFTAGTTQTVSSISGLTGTAGNLNVLNSTSSGSTWTLAGFIPVGVDYINLKDSIASPVTLYAGANSTNSGNNTNWLFSDIPTPDYDDAMMFGTII